MLRPLKKTRRSLLLPLVYVATLTLSVVTCAALALLGAEHVRATAIQTTLSGDQAVIAEFVGSTLDQSEVDGSAISSSRRLDLDRALARLAATHGYREATITLADGSIVAGETSAASAPAMTTQYQRSIATGQSSSAIDQVAGTSPTLAEAIPITENGVVRLVVTVERDASGLVASADTAWRDLLVVAGFAAVVLAILLRAIFQAANVRLGRQAEELAEARRRDNLTGLINHGETVARLTEVLATAQAEGASVGIALFDIDNFRLLNEVHGSAAGDEALLIVAKALDSESGQWQALGRFGPDEFLVIAPEEVARELPAAAKRVKGVLDEASLQFGDSERLPLTVSVGVTYFPFHATGVIELL